MNSSAATGDMDVLANHTPSIEHIRPGVVEVILECLIEISFHLC